MNLWPFFKDKDPTCKDLVGLDSMFKKKENNKYALAANSQKFNKLVLNSSYDVVYKQSENYSVEIKSSMRQLGEITIDIKHNVLTLGQREISYPPNFFKGVVVYVSAPEIISFDLYGSGYIEIHQNENKTNHDLMLILSGSGSIKFSTAYVCSKCFIKLTGSGIIECGKSFVATDFIKTQVTGSGACSISNLDCPSISNIVMGSGTIVLKKTKTQMVRNVLNGSGSIRVNGDIGRWFNTKNGSGSININ